MGIEIIEQVRSEYNKIRQETLFLYGKEIGELMADEKVRRYIELSKLIESISETSQENLVSEEFPTDLEASRPIMIFMGSYIVGEDGLSYLTYERDPETTFKLYRDLETAKWYQIPKAKCSEFDTQCLALYLPICEYSVREYCQKCLDFQQFFKEELYSHPIEEILNNLEKAFSHKYSDNPDFQRIDEIAEIPIAEYVERHPSNGVIECFCISAEERMRVRLYRKQKVNKENK